MSFPRKMFPPAMFGTESGVGVTASASGTDQYCYWGGATCWCWGRTRVGSAIGGDFRET